jgi:flagellin
VTSILTNTAATIALQTLRAVNSGLQNTQNRISSGLRVEKASDNAAYWSIATTMRSDNTAIGAVSDALGLGAAKVDTAYAGMDAVLDVLKTFKAKLVTAHEDGVDKAKVQDDLDQLKQQVVGIANSASFSGQNWLKTDVPDIFDQDGNKVFVSSAFVRDPSGSVTVQQTDVHLSDVSLFNSTGGGLLQADPRAIGSIGGIRAYNTYSSGGLDATPYYTDTSSGWMTPLWNNGSIGGFSLADFPVDAPLDFNIPGAEISFNVLVDKEDNNPNNATGIAGQLQELPGPYYAGYSQSVTITKADVDAYDASLGGIISTNTQFAAVLNSVLDGASVSANFGKYDPPGSHHWVHDPETMMITTNQSYGDGSYVEISDLSSVGVSTGGLVENAQYGTRGSGMVLNFEPFTAHIDGESQDGVSVNFDFAVNGTEKSYSFNRSDINAILGKDDGTVETADEMVTLLTSLLSTDWPDLLIQAASPSQIIMKSDPDVDRTWGSGTSIGFDNIRVSIEPLPAINFLNIDVEQYPDMIDDYLSYIEVASHRITSGAAVLGSLQSRIDMQSDFASKLMDSIDAGVGRLVDADMEEESSKLSAQQTQQQLAIQSLSIANSAPQSILSLFQR